MNDSTSVRSRARSASSSMRAETPTPRPCGMYTRKRDGSVMNVVRRAPLVPSGSLRTCTKSSSPSLTAARMSSVAGASNSASTSSRRAMSETCRNAVRSRPTSMNAACMPGSTRDTRPL